jgi:hypothetical protein
MGTIDRFRGHPLRMLGRTGSTVIVTVPVRLDRRGLRPGASPPPPYSHLDQRPAPAHDLATAGEHRAPAPASGGGGWGVRVRATVRRGGRRIHRDAYVRTQPWTHAWDLPEPPRPVPPSSCDVVQSRRHALGWTWTTPYVPSNPKVLAPTTCPMKPSTSRSWRFASGHGAQDKVANQTQPNHPCPGNHCRVKEGPVTVKPSLELTRSSSCIHSP